MTPTCRKTIKQLHAACAIALLPHQHSLEFWIAGSSRKRENREGNSDSKFEGSIRVSMGALLEKIGAKTLQQAAKLMSRL